MPGLSEASCALKSALLVCPLALVLTIVGMASPYWVADKQGIGNVGIWQLCSHVQGVTNCMSWSSLQALAESPEAYPGFIKATEAFEVLGCLAGGVAVLLVFACAFVEYVGRNKMSHVLAMLVNLLAGGLVLVGVIIFSAKYVEEFDKQGSVTPASLLSWAFGLCIVGAAGFLIMGCILILDVRQRWYL